MKEFKISPKGIDETISKTRFQSITLMIIVFISALIFFLYYTKDKENDLIDLLLPIAFMLGITIWGYVRAIKRQKALLSTFVIVVAESRIIRQQLNTSPVIISIDDIRNIFKDKKGNLVIKASSSKDVIYVPAGIDNFTELERLLQEIKPISDQNPYAIIDRYPVFVGLVSSALFLTVYLSTNKIVVGVTGTVLLVLMAWSVYQVQHSKHIDEKRKKRGYFVLLVMVYIIALMIFKLAGIMGY